MATINEILGIRSYQGDAAAGGGQVLPIKLDASPFEKLATYSFYENRDKWEQKNKKDEDAAKQIAELVALDPTTTNPEIYNYLNGLKQNIFNKIDEDPSVLNYQDNPQGYISLFRDYSNFKSARNKVTSNDVLVNKAITDANNQTDPLLREAMLADIEVQYSNQLKDGVESFINTKPLFSVTKPPTPDEFALPVADNVSYTTVEILDNFYKPIKTQVKNYDDLYSQSVQLAMGLNNKPFQPIPNPNNDPKIEAKNKADLASYNYKNKNKAAYSQSIADNYNTIAKEYYNKYNTWVNGGKVGQEPSKPDFIIASELANDKIRTANALLKEQSKRGALKGGNQQQIPTYREIDFTDGVDLSEIIYMDGVNRDDSKVLYEEELQQTDNAIQLAQLAEQVAARKQRGAQWEREFDRDNKKAGMVKDKNGNWSFPIGDNNTSSGSAYDSFIYKFNKATENSKKAKIMKLNELDPAIVFALNPSLVVSENGVLKVQLPKDNSGINFIDKEGSSKELKGGVNDIFVSVNETNGDILFQDKFGNNLTGYGLDGVRRKDDVDARGLTYLETLSKETKGQQSPYYVGDISGNKVSNTSGVASGSYSSSTNNSGTKIVNGKTLILPK